VVVNGRDAGGNGYYNNEALGEVMVAAAFMHQYTEGEVINMILSGVCIILLIMVLVGQARIRRALGRAENK